ncbi:murein biosynthesis integral membrane protein MurJ [Paractinoplanes rishiriensis]|uniref:murein biosynthesis integral membrane protein MurJ n=1 Tax=Paractinoplanes rishiriensis TaxID=1050105 RepID=UPI0019448FBE|nr:murein biosynthesis integral membrane protein MurJ [Actinoplanes rishiriensis]
MAVATLASRAGGFLRVVVLTAALGLGTRLLDTYNVANTLPNAVYELVIGGAMATVVVPLLARAAVTEPDGGVRYAQRLITLLACGLAGITVLALLVAPWLVDLYAPGFTAGQRDLAITFSRYFLPQILFYGVSATAAAVLNVRGRFAAPAWAPLASSAVVIAVCLCYLAGLAGGHHLLAAGTTAGVVTQTTLVLWVLRRTGFPLRPADPRGIGVRRIAKLAGWVLLSVAAAQVLLAAATRSASLAGPGGVTAFQNAHAVFRLPFAVIALSVMTAMLPGLSRRAAERDHRRVIGDLSRAVRVTLVVLAPVAAAFVLLGGPIATLLFQHGNSAAGTVRLLGLVLGGFGLALVPFAGFMVLQRGLYALQDTRTPALITAGTAAIGVLGCVVAGRVWPVAGIPIAYAVAYTAGLVATAVALRRRLGRIDGRRLLGTHLRVLAAVAVAAGCATLAIRSVAPAGALVTVLAGGLAGGVGYLAAARVARLSLR